MNEDRPWLGEEPTGRPDPTFRPWPTGFGVFLAVAAPIVFYGISRAGGTDVTVVAIGVVAGIVVGALVGSWLAAHGGEGPRSPL